MNSATALDAADRREAPRLGVLEYASPTPIRLECEGQIFRVERREGKLGVAAAITASRPIPTETLGFGINDFEFKRRRIP